VHFRIWAGNYSSIVSKLVYIYFSFQCTSSTWGSFNVTKCFYLLQKVDFAGGTLYGVCHITFPIRSITDAHKLSRCAPAVPLCQPVPPHFLRITIQNTELVPKICLASSNWPLEPASITPRSIFIWPSQEVVHHCIAQPALTVIHCACLAPALDVSMSRDHNHLASKPMSSP
jgi:hypothetical protein